MASPSEILNDPNYINANAETKQAIFDKHVASSSDYTSANEETKSAIKQRFGLTVSKVEAAKEEKPTAEKIFGPGVGAEATGAQRLAATGEAAVGSALVGEAMRRVGLKMAARHAAAAMTGAGATPLVQGALLGMDAYELMKMTAVGGAVGSMVEQAAEKMGAGRGTQVAMGALVPGMGPTVSRGIVGAAESLGPKLGSALKSATYALGPVGYKVRAAGYGLKGALEGASKEQATEAARAGVLAGTSPEAGEITGKALETGVARETGKFKTALQLQKERAAVAAKEAATATEEAKSGIAAAKTPDELGQEVQKAVTKKQETLLKERATGYKERYESAIDSAKAKEESGLHFGASEEGSDVRQALNQRIKGTGSPTSDYTSDQKSQFSKLKEQIFGRKGAVDPITGEKLPDIKPASAKQLDTLVRRLGDAAFGKETEGAKAIDSQVAKDVRSLILNGSDGKGGIYSWEPKFAEAKSFYKAKSDELGPWSTKRGQAVTSKEDFQGVLAQRPSMDPSKVPQQYFNTPRGYSDLVSQLGGDSKQAAAMGEQYALKQLEGKTAAESQKWLDKSTWLENPQAKTVRDKIETHIIEQGQKEGRAGALTEKAENIPFIKDIDTKVAAKLDKLESDFKLGSDVGVRMEKVLGGEMRSSDIKAFKEVLGDNPEAIKVLPDVAIQYIVKGKDAATITGRAKQVLQNLEKSGMISKDDAARILNESNKVANVAGGKINNKKQLDSWSTHFSKRLLGATTRMMSDYTQGKVKNITIYGDEE